MSQKKINIAIIGLGFGAEFIPIYQKHPLANMYAICQRNQVSILYSSHGYRIIAVKHQRLKWSWRIRCHHINYSFRKYDSHRRNV